MFESLSALRNAFKLPDLRNRIYYVGLMFAVFVFGLHIPVPNIDREAMARLLEQSGALLGLFDAFSGGALKRFSIFAMSITPYINASIIFQLLGMASPTIQGWAKEGEAGRRRIGTWTRYLTIALALFQAGGISYVLYRRGIVQVDTVVELVPIVLTLTAGTCFLMWLGEQITDRGIGNGVSLIIFAGIMARMPSDIYKTLVAMQAGAFQIWQLGLLMLFFVGTIMGIIYVQQGQRKIPIQHAKRVIGNRIYGGTSSYLPLRVNTAGVIPIIFAISVSMLPGTLGTFLAQTGWQGMLRGWMEPLMPGASFWGSAIYFMLVIGFTYFYTAVTFNVPDVSDNLKRSGGYIPGIRPGKPTTDFLDRVLTRITLAGAVFLGVIALLQYYVPSITGIPTSSFSLVGGTSLLIVVGVALETMQQIETHLVMRHYEGFIK